MALTKEERLIRHRECNKKYYEKMKLDDEKVSRKRESWRKAYHSRYSRADVREWKSDYNKRYQSIPSVAQRQSERLARYAKTEKRRFSMLTYRARRFISKNAKCVDSELVAATVAMMLLKRAIRNAKEANNG